MHLKLAAALIMALSSLANADVVLKPEYKYDDFFKNCRGSIYFEGDAASITGAFSYGANGFRWACGLDRHESGGGGHRCEGEIGVEYQCEDVTGMTIHALRCLDDAGGEISCGDISIVNAGAPEIAVAPNAAVQGTRLVAIESGFDDFFGRCELDFVVNTPYPDGEVAFDYVISAAGESEAQTCEQTVFANGGGGKSCSGVFGHEFTCDQIDKVVATKPRCLDENEAERDCGPISVVSVGVKDFAVSD